MSANDKQVGGTHYQTGYQCWDFILKHNLPGLETLVVKYVTRARRKHASPKGDYEKALHCIDKMIEAWEGRTGNRWSGVKNLRCTCSLKNLRPGVLEDCHRYCAENNLTPAERSVIEYMCVWTTTEDLKQIQKHLSYILACCS